VIIINSYEINTETLAILPYDFEKSKIIEVDNEFIINQKPSDIIEYSCQYFGSSYSGRKIGTERLIGVTHKSPIIIEESREIIFFPTTSPRIDNCCWISLNNISNYYRKGLLSKILFKTGYELEINISYNSLDNQILRSTRLESVIRKRKGFDY
jgi:competence protein ComK